MSSRIDGRENSQIRPVKIETGVSKHAEGSVIIEMGDTRVLCTATVEESVPPFRKGSGKGWITAEYGMLPRSTSSRMAREAARGKQGGRTLEIQRLIGRSLRAVVDLEQFGERTLRLDCDVLQADGGTRTASITGAYVAMLIAFNGLVEKNLISRPPVTAQVAAVSAGIVDGVAMLDLCYEEDSSAMVDLNVVMTDGGELVEIQGTGEERPFSREKMDEMLDLAQAGVKELVAIQKAALEG